MEQKSGYTFQSECAAVPVSAHSAQDGERKGEKVSNRNMSKIKRRSERKKHVIEDDKC
jgi:hypothetical protein